MSKRLRKSIASMIAGALTIFSNVEPARAILDVNKDVDCLISKTPFIFFNGKMFVRMVDLETAVKASGAKVNNVVEAFDILKKNDENFNKEYALFRVENGHEFVVLIDSEDIPLQAVYNNKNNAPVILYITPKQFVALNQKGILSEIKDHCEENPFKNSNFAKEVNEIRNGEDDLGAGEKTEDVNVDELTNSNIDIGDITAEELMDIKKLKDDLKPKSGSTGNNPTIIEGGKESDPNANSDKKELQQRKGFTDLVMEHPIAFILAMSTSAAIIGYSTLKSENTDVNDELDFGDSNNI